MGTDESVFNRILVTRSPPHLEAVCRKYREVDQQDLVKAIESETSGDVRDAYVAIGEHRVQFKCPIKLCIFEVVFVFALYVSQCALALLLSA